MAYDVWRSEKPGGACRLGLKVMTSSRNRVTFVSPSPNIILLRATQCYIFCRNCGLLLRITPLNGLLLAVPLLFRGGLLQYCVGAILRGTSFCRAKVPTLMRKSFK
jgi:hypothetical protein